MSATLLHGDSLKILPTFGSDSVDAVVTDPPAGIAFMGKEWDTFGGSAPKRSGYESRDRNGFMQDGRGLTVASGTKGRERFIAFLRSVFVEVLRVARPGAVALVWAIPRTSHWTATALEDAGWQIEDRLCHLFAQGFPKHHSKLKPACEDWWLCRKPGPKWLGVEECRVPTTDSLSGGDEKNLDKRGKKVSKGWDRPWMHDEEKLRARQERCAENVANAEAKGRWPANVVHDGSDEVLEGFPRSSVTGKRSDRSKAAEVGNTNWFSANHESTEYTDSGSAARFFYCAKASKSDRGEGNTHPTVKPLSLMSWLVKLACPAGGTVLDPFTGSGSTAVACLREGRGFIGVEREVEYVEIARKRIAEEEGKHPLFQGVKT